MAYLLMPMSDPVVSCVFATTLSIILLVGAWHKIKEPVVFSATLENYRLLPEYLVFLVTFLVPIVELSAGTLLLFPQTLVMGGQLALLLLAFVTGAVAINVWRGNTHIDCGCGGAQGQLLSWALVMRNGLLMGMAVLAMQEVEWRPLLWVDYLTVGSAVLALYGIYVSANQLMTTAPRAMAVRQ
jgi:hypothetical protein